MDIFKRRKAQGLSINIIIVAAIGLLVLVILAVVFIGRLGITTKSVNECQGACIQSSDDCTGQFQKVTRDPCFDAGGDATDEVCCLSVA